MLPEVQLRPVTRDDVDRIGSWLESEEISSKWFGHYGCGDPIHRGYDPEHMVEAPDFEWDATFSGPDRMILSIFSERDEHIGECQVSLDHAGGGEVSLLIGRRDLWHLGYGTSTLMALMGRSFDQLGLRRIWVNVPADNYPALGLFGKLGFVAEEPSEVCKPRYGDSRRFKHLEIDAVTYDIRESKSPLAKPTRDLVVTLTGLPGSGTDLLGAALSKRLGCSFVESDILDAACERLKRTPAEIEALEATLKSFWARLLDSMVLPMEWSAAYDASHHWYRYDSGFDYGSYPDPLTRDQYVKALSGVVGTFAAQGKVVLSGRGTHVLTPDSVRSLHVFVSQSDHQRSVRVLQKDGLDLNENARINLLARLDREDQSVFNSLFGCGMLDMSKYDLTVNLDRMSMDEAVDGIVAVMTESRRESSSDLSPSLDTV